MSDCNLKAHASGTVPTSSDQSPKGPRWNVGPSKRWQIFREADYRNSGIRWGEEVPNGSTFVDALNGLRQDATSREFAHAASGFLFRKVMDSPNISKNQKVKSYQRQMGSPPDAVPANWRLEAERTIKKVFPMGWDRNWKTIAAEHFVAKGKAVAEEGLSSDEYWRGKSGWWYTHVVGGVEPDYDDRYIPELREIKVIDEGGGKMRVITVASGKQHVLAPLHKMIYAKLSGQKWLLRGDASGSRLRDMKYKKGEVFVSGDYESATDNIPSSFSRLLIRLILQRCRHVPEWLRDAAVDSLVGFTNWFGDVAWQGTGQLMGNYLSFPLLCLHNFVTFLVGMGSSRGWQLASSGLLLINGDDILFRSTREEFESWASSVKSGGLTLSKGKTLVHCRFASINSTFFCITKKARRISVIRAKTWFYKVGEGGGNERDVMTEGGITGRLKRVSADCHRKESVVAFFLAVWGKEIYALKSGSVTKSCGPLPVPAHVEGLTRWATVLDSVWKDPVRRAGRSEGNDSCMGVGNVRGRRKYWLSVASGVNHEETWREEKPNQSLESGVVPPPDNWEVRGVRPHTGCYGLTFRSLWSLAKKRWRRQGAVVSRDRGGVVVRGLPGEVPEFEVGVNPLENFVNERMWRTDRKHAPMSYHVTYPHWGGGNEAHGEEAELVEYLADWVVKGREAEGLSLHKESESARVLLERGKRRYALIREDYEIAWGGDLGLTTIDVGQEWADEVQEVHPSKGERRKRFLTWSLNRTVRPEYLWA